MYSRGRADDCVLELVLTGMTPEGLPASQCPTVSLPLGPLPTCPQDVLSGRDITALLQKNGAES